MMAVALGALPQGEYSVGLVINWGCQRCLVSKRSVDGQDSGKDNPKGQKSQLGGRGEDPELRTTLVQANNRRGDGSSVITHLCMSASENSREKTNQGRNYDTAPSDT